MEIKVTICGSYFSSDDAEYKYTFLVSTATLLVYFSLELGLLDSFLLVAIIDGG